MDVVLRQEMVKLRAEELDGITHRCVEANDYVVPAGVRGDGFRQGERVAANASSAPFWRLACLQIKYDAHGSHAPERAIARPARRLGLLDLIQDLGGMMRQWWCSCIG